MDPISRLEDLKTVASRLSINIVSDCLFDPEITIQSGYCKIRGKKMIILDKSLTIEDQSEIILHTLKQFNLEAIYLPLWIREYIEADSIKRSQT